MLKEISDKYFEKHLINSKNPILVFIWAPWCSNCKAMMPVVSEIAADQIDEIQVVKLNGDENQDFIKKYKVFGLPTTLIFCHGFLIDRKTGMQTKSVLLKRVNEFKKISFNEAKEKEIKGMFSWPFKRSRS